MPTTLVENSAQLPMAKRGRDNPTSENRGARTQERRTRHRLGTRAERIAVWFLRCKGYRILAVRARLPVGEIDIVAKKSGILIFVEVKARPTLHDAMIAISKRQQKRIVAASEGFVAQQAKWAKFDRRYDLIAIVPGRLPSHIKDAWRP